MRKPIVYKHETEAGLKELIQNSNSIAYVVEVRPHNIEPAKLASFASANNIEDSDILYPTKSVLVSTNWNLNDDIFLIDEVWAARHTPRNKPTNIDHQKHKIVGHITDTWAIDSEGNIIPDDTAVEDLTDFHLCNAAVIYKFYPGDEELTARAEKLIEEIEAGTKYVSMECLFPAFDYAFSNGSEIKVLPRNAQSSFLTKHLRCYGGVGEYEGYKIGRALRSIEFSGKGYVDKPANPNSIIFNSDDEFCKSSVISIDLNDILGSDKKTTNFVVASLPVKEEIFMNEDLIKSKLESQDKLIAELTQANKDLVEKVAASNIAKFEEKIASLEAQVATVTSEKNELSTKVADLEKGATETAAQLEEVTKAKVEAEAKVQAAEAEALKANRVATLVDGGIEKDAAVANVEKFINLSDEQFTAISEVLISAVSKEEAKEGAEASEEVDPSKVLEEAVTEEGTQLGAAAADNVNTTRNDLIQSLASQFSSMLDNDEEEETQE